MTSQLLKPEENQINLSLPTTPAMMSVRRGSMSMPMSAKLMYLRGESDPPAPKQEGKTTAKVSKNIRFMQKNGRCNIKQEAAGTREKYLKDFFTTLVDMKWRNNLIFYIATYFIAWSFFGLLWYCIALWRGDIMDPKDIKNTTANHTRRNCVENVYSYTTAFLFFVETETSVGYGKRAITEQCAEAIILFVIQALLGNVLDAFMIGCIFIKISQPKNRAETLVFSENCIISPRDKTYCLLFRVGNLRNSLMVQCRIRAKLVKARQTQEGEFLALHQDDINVGYDTGADNLFLVTPLIISHEINEKSPFYRMSKEDFRRTRFEIIVILEGMIESTGMICQARTSYTNDEIIWGRRFAPVIAGGNKCYTVDHSSFHDFMELDMPEVSMYEFETDVKLNKENSRFYKYVKENNIGMFRENLKMRLRRSRKGNHGCNNTSNKERKANGANQDEIQYHSVISNHSKRSTFPINGSYEDREQAAVIDIDVETAQNRLNATNRDDGVENSWEMKNYTDFQLTE